MGHVIDGWHPLEHNPALRLSQAEARSWRGLHGEESLTHVARAVLRVLDRHVSRGELDGARREVPPELRVLWPGAPAEVRP